MSIPKRTAEQQTFPGLDLDTQATLPLRWTKKASANNAFDEANAPNLGKVLTVVVPDFANPKRPKTCLEVDFPLVPVNAIAKVETSSGPARKRIYCMSKWWARRASTVFRAMLLAAATQAPIRKQADGSVVLDQDGIPVPDETEAAKAVWDTYYANHQKAGNFKDLKVLDCFMGGGTTLVEGSRLGFQVVGVDLNPVAWFIVKNELACTNPDEVREFFDQVDSEVKPLIQPFYVAECQRGHIGRWYRNSITGDTAEERLMPDSFDALTLSVAERVQYRYEGPELIYTFWAKHGVCSQPGCGHRTPIFRSPVIAEKKLGVKYVELTCKSCKIAFHAELGAARMAPGAERVVLDSEFCFTELSQPFAKRMADYSKGDIAEKRARIKELCEMVHSEPGLMCPKCGEFAGQYLRDILNQHASAKRLSAIDKKHLNIQPPRNGTKHVYSYLMIDPEWLKGTAGIMNDKELGGYADAAADSSGAGMVRATIW